MNFTDMIKAITSVMGTSVPPGISDDLAKAYVSTTGQQSQTAAQTGVQAALQQQQNLMNFIKMYGVDEAGNQTDESRQWQAQLKAQQDVQNQRLLQELGGLTGQYGGQDTLAEKQRKDAAESAEKERQLRERLQGGQQTWQAQESKYERELREKLQAGQLTQQESEYARNYLIQQGNQRGYVMDANGNSTGQLTEAGRAAREAEAARMAEISGQVAGGGLTEQSRAAREQERNQRASLAAQLLSAPKDVFKAGAFFRSLGGSAGNMMGLGGGGVSGFNTMAGRMATPGTVSLEDVEAQAGGPMQQAQATGGGMQPDMLNGGKMAAAGGAGVTGSAAAAPVTQGQVAAASGQADPQAAAMAKLLGTGSAAAPAQPDPAMAQLQGVIPAGEDQVSAAVMNADPNAAANRGAKMAEMLQGMQGNQGGDAFTADQQAEFDPNAATRGRVTANEPMLTTSDPGYDPVAQAAKDAKVAAAGDNTSSLQAGTGAVPDDAMIKMGSQPGGPVGDPSAMVAAGLGDLGIGGGGNFTGRAQPSGVTDAIPYVDPRVLNEPEVRAMFRDMKRQGLANDAASRRVGRGTRPSGPGGPTGRTGEPAAPGPHRFGQKIGERRRNSSERMLLGLNRILQKASIPGTQPGGPVDAPLWPADGGGTGMPQVQESSSLGGDSSFQAPAAASSASPIASVDPGNQNAALEEMMARLAQGPGSMGPQTLEKMSGTQRGIMEGALEALGLRPEDFNEAYAQTRFANTGNVLSA
jgi:hypothetical protein